MNQLRLRIQYSEDQTEKNASIYKEKLEQKDDSIRNLSRKNEELQEKANELQNFITEKSTKIQKL